MLSTVLRRTLAAATAAARAAWAAAAAPALMAPPRQLRLLTQRPGPTGRRRMTYVLGASQDVLSSMQVGLHCDLCVLQLTARRPDLSSRRLCLHRHDVTAFNSSSCTGYNGRHRKGDRTFVNLDQ